MRNKIKRGGTDLLIPMGDCDTDWATIRGEIFFPTEFGPSVSDDETLCAAPAANCISHHHGACGAWIGSLSHLGVLARMLA